MICFLGTSHAAEHLRNAAYDKGCKITHNAEAADLIFVSEDTPTDDDGHRNLNPIRALVDRAYATGKPIVLTSQVPPGFTRSPIETRPYIHIYYQAETLRIKDAEERARNPEYIVIGCSDEIQRLPLTYREYLSHFSCPFRMMKYEEAEFSKIAINMMLAAQVDATNKLSQAAERVGASWEIVASILQMDKRIGPFAYLEPGRWQDSKHLLRDHITLEEICTQPDTWAKSRQFAQR